MMTPSAQIQMAHETQPLRIEYKALEDLIPQPQNARTHTKHQIRQIAESIRVFGFTNPILIDSKNWIIAGHGRREAAKLLGMQKVPTIRLDQLTDDQIRAYVLADNKLAENAGWEPGILAIELQYLMTLVDVDFDVTTTGFEVPEIDLILHESASKDTPQEIIEVARGTAVSQIGDLWLLGKHRILCGNSLAKASFERLMNGKKAGRLIIGRNRGIHTVSNSERSCLHSK